MTLQQGLELVFRWLHILPTIVLVGGLFFLRFVLIPATTETAIDASWKEPVRKRFSRLVMLSIGLLLVSGLYNAAQKAIGFELTATYLALLSVKILLALVIFFLVSLLSGRSERAETMRLNEISWLNATCVLMVLLICIAGALKTSPQQIKVDETIQAQQNQRGPVTLVR